MVETNDNENVINEQITITDEEADAVEVIIKRGRGRPRKIVNEEEEAVKKKRGRPMLDPSCCYRDKEYYAKYYRDHLQGIMVRCPICDNRVKKVYLSRHVRTNKCFTDAILCKFINVSKIKPCDAIN